MSKFWERVELSFIWRGESNLPTTTILNSSALAWLALVYIVSPARQGGGRGDNGRRRGNGKIMLKIAGNRRTKLKGGDQKMEVQIKNQAVLFPSDPVDMYKRAGYATKSLTPGGGVLIVFGGKKWTIHIPIRPSLAFLGQILSKIAQCFQNFPKMSQIGSNLRKFWKIYAFIYQIMHFIWGHSYTKRLILLPMLAAGPRRVYEYPRALILLHLNRKVDWLVQNYKFEVNVCKGCTKSRMTPAIIYVKGCLFHKYDTQQSWHSQKWCIASVYDTVH